MNFYNITARIEHFYKGQIIILNKIANKSISK